MARLLAAGINCLFGTVSAAANTIAQGWGDSIEWMTLSQGMKRAKEENKIMIAVVKHDQCVACNQLKKVFNNSKELQKLADQFVMVSVTADEVGKRKNFHPDGNYVPRVLFFEPTGKLMVHVKRNTKLKRWRYNYATESQVMASMKKVLNGFSKNSSNS